MTATLSKNLYRLAVLLILATLLAGLPSPAVASVWAVPGDRTLVSVDSSGVPGNAGSYSASMSNDGRFVAFASDASNLVSPALTIGPNIFVRDRQTGTTTLVSLSLLGGQANGGSEDPSISGDGRYVAFASDASDLVSVDANATTDVFVRDRQTGTTTMVSVDSIGTQADDISDSASISADGRFVAFSSSATNLVAGDTNGLLDIFVHDMQTGETTRASVDSSGIEANGHSRFASISGDGRLVAFSSDATNLISGDTNGRRDIFVRDRLSAVTTRASVTTSGAEGTLAADTPAISADGRFVMFSSQSDLLVGTDTFGFDQIFARDLLTNETSLVTINVADFPFVGKSFDPSVSADGRYVAFQFNDQDSIPDFEVVVQDRQTRSTVHASGSFQDLFAGSPAMSGDGRFVAFTADASLVGADTNGAPDVYVNELQFIADLAPTVTAITRADPNPTTAASLNFNVTFSESVSGVDTSDFTLALTGDVSGATVATVSGSGSAYVVTVNVAAGSGTVRLDVVDDDTINDGSGQRLGGTGAGNGNFNTGEAYTIDRSVPVVTASLRASPNPSTSPTVHFSVTFSEAVTGVDASDFGLNTLGLVGAAVSSVDGSGNTYSVGVSTGVGNGTIRLDVIDNDTIVDVSGNPLGGTGAGNGNFTTGEVFTINKKLLNTTLRSNGTNDGWILESNENSNVGGALNSNQFTFNVGDDAANRQYRSLMHFPTSALPDNALITFAMLVVRRQGVVGTDPFTTHQNIQVDIHFGPYGDNPLELADFSSPSSSPAGVIQNTPVGDFYFAALDSLALPFINLTGVTQLRLGFQLDDDNDSSADYLRFFSGNYLRIADRPMLYLEYFAP